MTIIHREGLLVVCANVEGRVRCRKASYHVLVK